MVQPPFAGLNVLFSEVPLGTAAPDLVPWNPAANQDPRGFPVPGGIATGGQGTISAEAPISAEVRAVPRMDAAIPTGEYSSLLCLKDLVNRTEIVAYPVRDPASLAGGRGSLAMLRTGPGGWGPLVWRDKTVFVHSGDRIYTFTPDDELLKKLPVPFSFEMRQEKFVVGAAGSTSLAHTVRGAVGKVQFDLDTTGGQRDWISVDQSSGTVQVNGPALVKSLSENEQFRAWLQRLPTLEGARPENPGEEALAVLRAQFQELVGRASKSAPIVVPIHVRASDESLAQAQLRYYVFLELPLAKWKALIGKEGKDGNKAKKVKAGTE